MQNINIFLAFFILGSVLTTTTAMSLSDVYADLPASIKTILMKYKDQTTTIDYTAFLADLKTDNEYMMLEDKLGMGALTKDSLKTVFEAYINDMTTEMSTTVAPATLAAVYESLPDSIKTILMKYQNQTTIDYTAFLMELKADNTGYMTLKEKLGMTDITKESLQTLFEAYVKDVAMTTTTMADPGNSGMRSGVTIGSVVMVTVMTMLMPFLN